MSLFPSNANRARRGRAVLWSGSTAAIITGLLLSGPVTPPPPPLEVDIALSPAFSGTDFFMPLLLKQPPGDSTRFMVVEQRGTVQMVKGGVISGFMDITDRVRPPQPEGIAPKDYEQNYGEKERGLHGFAFDPAYPTSDYVYVSYTTRGDGDFDRAENLVEGDTVVSRFQITNQDGVDTGTETIILSVPQYLWNHNGGQVEFGPDGHLYIALGDGGGGGDPENNAQDTTNLLGKILRVNVDSLPYTIPSGNPFAGEELCDDNTARTEPCPEIYVHGLRNPWRLSFDDEGSGHSGDMWLGDVGQNAWEEINRVPLPPDPPARNYGWDCREGPVEFLGVSSPLCGSDSYIGPVAWYSRSYPDCSVTGGYVYRGAAIPDLVGSYVYGDFCSGILRGLPYYSIPGSAAVVLLDSTHAISTFGRDNAGELYLADWASGTIHKVVPAP